MARPLIPAYVLHRRAWQDTSAIVEIFTADHGRLGLLARGLLGPGSRRRGLVQPFVPLLISWAGRGELPTLGRTEEVPGRHLIAGRRLPAALYLNEILVRLVERGEPAPELFESYHATLVDLATAATVQPALRYFERNLLRELGVALVLERDHAGQPLQENKYYRYLPDSGPVPEESARPGSGPRVSGRSLKAFAHHDLNSRQVLKEIAAVTRCAIDHQLGGRPLHSRRLLLSTKADAEK